MTGLPAAALPPLPGDDVIGAAAARELAPERPASVVPSPADLAVAQQLVATARERGLALLGPDGLLGSLTKSVIEAALDEAITEHLGYDKHAPAGRSSGNSRVSDSLRAYVDLP